MNRLIASTVMLLGAGLSAQQVEGTPATGLEPSLALALPYRAAIVAGEAGRRYTLFVGLDRGVVPVVPGVELGIRPLAVVQSGVLDAQGYAYAAIDPHSANAVGTELLFQALLWPPIPSVPDPDRVSGIETMVLRAWETDPPAVMPPERIWIDDQTTDLEPTVGLLYIDGVPPVLAAAIDVTVPTTGYRLCVDAVLHAGSFTRVLVTVERPGPGELLGWQFQDLHAIAPLGYWADRIEVVVRERTRSLGAAASTGTAPTSNGASG